MYRDPEALETIPEEGREVVVAFIEHGIDVGGFLTALLANDLREAVTRADKKNLAALVPWVHFLYNHAPAECHGSYEKVGLWQEKGGLLG